VAAASAGGSDGETSSGVAFSTKRSAWDWRRSRSSVASTTVRDIRDKRTRQARWRWQVMQDYAGQTYYVDTKTGECFWERPNSFFETL
jgi:hypothetical protein